MGRTSQRRFGRLLDLFSDFKNWVLSWLEGLLYLHGFVVLVVVVVTKVGESGVVLGLHAQHGVSLYICVVFLVAGSEGF